MRLGMHTYSLYHHGVAEDWAGSKLPWERQTTLFEIMDYIMTLGLEGLHLECPLDSMEAAMATEKAALERSVAYCRDVLRSNSF